MEFWRFGAAHLRLPSEISEHVNGRAFNFTPSAVTSGLGVKLDDLGIVRGIPEGPVVWARRRVGALTFVFAPSWVLAAALMPFAQSGESFGNVRRLIKLWRQQLRNKSPPGDASYLQKKSED